jgi:ABC-type branched-subunit amino acid transport system ATPase component
MSFVIIEHDLDIALRVVERVTVMHNGRVLKHGTPDEIENDAQVQAIYMGKQTLMAWFARPTRPAAATGAGHRRPGRLLRPRPCAAGGFADAADHGVLGIVGRNGMGKTTLCNAITGLVPAAAASSCRRRDPGPAAEPASPRRGIGYVPQGRRVWPSLSVDETLRSGRAEPKRDVDRVYTLFPRLAERKGNGGAQLSGGEQQMLAIGRALLLKPRLLVMDEPTEGPGAGHRRAGRAGAARPGRTRARSRCC